MNKYLMGTGLAVVVLSVSYFISKSRNEEVSPLLTYGLGIVSCIFITAVLFNVMQHFKKK